jgi:hypothetical protein
MGTGALKRRYPSGGAAYGIPNHFSVPFAVETPRNVPEVRDTSNDAAAVETEKVAGKTQSIAHKSFESASMVVCW